MQQLKEILRWRTDWSGRHDPESIGRRTAFLRGLDPESLPLIANRVRDARDGRMGLARELAWPIFDELEMVNEVLVTTDPLDLLNLANDDSDDPMHVQRRFEALSILDLAIALHELERQDSMDRVEKDLKTMIGFLEQHLFSGATRDLDIYTYHDAADMYRVKGVSYDEPGSFLDLRERKHNSRCRVTRDGMVLRFDLRPKDRFRTVLKMVKQADEDAEGEVVVVRDRCGFRFVVQDRESAAELARELRWLLVASGARVIDDGNNLTVDQDAPADVCNVHSSPAYKVLKLSANWHGRWYEFQIVLFSTYYSSKYALDDANHVVYRMRQAIKNAFPILFPGPIYLEEGTWESESLRRLLHERQIENLGWFQRRQQNGRH